MADSGSPAATYNRVPQESPAASRHSEAVHPSFFDDDEVHELTFADSFALGALRGFRVLQAASCWIDTGRKTCDLVLHTWFFGVWPGDQGTSNALG